MTSRRRFAQGVALILFGVVLLALAAETARGTREPVVVTAIRQEFGTGWLGGCFARIAWRESRFDARASNWADANGGSHGALQINGVWRRRGESPAAFAQRMYDPAANARLAHQIYRRYGVQPWGSC
jgi:hypothetical protein